jgi:hypothetical protein
MPRRLCTLVEAARRALVGALVASLILTAPGTHQLARAQGGSDARAGTAMTLDRFMTILELLRLQIDRTQFDVEALALELAFEDPEAIARWVRDNIAFQQYSGMLRGTHGTLISRSGNALDQAVLLAKLLRDAGYEAVIAEGELQDAEAIRLLEQMGRVPDRPPPFQDGAIVDEVLTEMLATWPIGEGMVGSASLDGVRSFLAAYDSTRGGDEAKSRAPLPPIENVVDDMIRAMGWSSDSVADPTAVDLIISEARHYHWVLFRVGPTDEWQEAHPAYVSTAEAPRVEANDIFDSTVPERLHHRFGFRVGLTRWIGDREEEVEVVPLWERPVANLVGVDLSFTSVPDGIQEFSDLEHLEERLADTAFFVPLFQGRPAPGGQFFDLAGNVVPPDAATSPYAGVFQAVGAATARAATALDGLSRTEPRPAQGLRQLWVEYTLATPGGSRETHRRDIVPASIDVASSPELLPWALMTSHTFEIAVGEYSPAYVLDGMLAAALGLRSFLEAASHIDGVPGPDEVDGLVAQFEEAPPAWLGHKHLFNSFDIATVVSDAVVYRSGPSLVVFESRPSPTLVSVEAFDIVTNPRRAFAREGEVLDYRAGEVLRAGVWESYVESEGGGQPIARMGAFANLKGAAEAGAPLMRLQEPNDISALDVDDVAKRHMLDDLARGYDILYPRPVNGRPATAADTAWWRLDPSTGNTLARSGAGRGEGVNYVALLSSGLGVAIAIKGTMALMKCHKFGEGTACYVCSALAIAFGAAGLIVTVGGSAAVLASFTVANAEIWGLVAALAGAFADIGCEFWAVL